MRLALHMPHEPGEIWDLSRQIGVTDLVCELPANVDDSPTWDLGVLRKLRDQAAEAGLRLAVIEGNTPMEGGAARLGLPGRDLEIEHFCQMIENLGAVGVDVVCYNFMAGFSWLRTNATVPIRGGALSMEYDHAQMESQGPPETEVLKVGPDGTLINEERLWERGLRKNPKASRQATSQASCGSQGARCRSTSLHREAVASAVAQADGSQVKQTAHQLGREVGYFFSSTQMLR